MEPQGGGHLDAEFHLGIYEIGGSELLKVLHGCRWRLQLQLAYIEYGRKTMVRSLRDGRPLLGWSSRSSDEDT